MTKRSNFPAVRLSVALVAAALCGTALAQTTTAPRALPGYVTSSSGQVVLSGYGQCVRSQFWVPADAAEPCDRVARAELAPPPPVAEAPAPAPAPVVLAAVEPPRPV